MADVLFWVVALSGFAICGLISQAYVRFLRRRLPPILATIVMLLSALAAFAAFLLVAGLLFVGGDVASMKAETKGPPSSCAIEGQPCDDIEREAYLADLAGRQIRDIPVLVGWRDELRWGEQTRITAVIASADRAAAEASIDKAFADQHVDRQTVAIGRKVRAELTGENVEIVKPEQTVRDVTRLQNVTFEWLVKPTRPGKTVLTLRIFNELVTPNGPIELERPALVREMSVKIGVLDWLTWQMEQTKGLVWVIGGLLTVLGVVFTNRAKLRRWWRRRRVAEAGAATPPPPPAPPSSRGS